MKLFLLLGRLKSFCRYIEEPKQREFLELVGELEEKSLELAEGNGKKGRITSRTAVNMILIGNLFLFPLVNFIARCFDPNAPQITFEIEKLIKILLPYLSVGT